MKKDTDKEPEQYIMICPKCKSSDVYMDHSNPAQGALGLPAIYICDKCGHSGTSFPEVLMTEENVLKEDAKREGVIDTKKDETPIIDTRYGAFEVKVMWKILAPLDIIVGIIILFSNLLIGSGIIIAGLFIGYFAYIKKRKIRD